MTHRKPGGISFESFAERQIRAAQEAGAFDNLSGAGKPIPGLDKPHNPLWWTRNLLEREGIEAVPAALALRRDVERALERLVRIADERLVRAEVAELNARIAKVNATITSGPGSSVVQLDADQVIGDWARARDR